MRIKLDGNLPDSLRDVLRSYGHDGDTVCDGRLVGRPDRVVWQAAQDGARMLITQDLDFSDVRTFAPGTHHGLWLVRLAKPGSARPCSSMRTQS